MTDTDALRDAITDRMDGGFDVEYWRIRMLIVASIQAEAERDVALAALSDVLVERDAARNCADVLRVLVGASGAYVAQDADGGWYADACGVIQDADPGRTREQALAWAAERVDQALRREADAEIARLRADLARARDALEQIRDAEAGPSRIYQDSDDAVSWWCCETCDNTHAIADAALAAPEPTTAEGES